MMPEGGRIRILLDLLLMGELKVWKPRKERGRLIIKEGRNQLALKKELVQTNS